MGDAGKNEEVSRKNGFLIVITNSNIGFFA